MITQTSKYNYTLTLKKNNSNIILFNSLLSLLNGSFADSSFSKLYFCANKVQTLTDYLLQNKFSFDSAINMIQSLTAQQLFLEDLQYTFFSLFIEDIIVIDEKIFINTLPNIKQIQTNSIQFNSPFIRNEFISPEMKNIDSLPAIISYKTIYFSLGALIYYCLKKDYSTFYGTKLYWFLLKNSNIDINKRNLIF